jgi:hypothetical protein
MRIKNTLQVGLDIKDPISFCKNKKEKITQMLTEKYVGKCFGGCLIESIDTILEMSLCRLPTVGPPLYATTSVKFRVNALVLGAGEILTGVSVVGKDSRSVICKTANIGIGIDRMDFFNAVKIGQKIAIRVMDVGYDINNSIISVIAEPFLPQPTCTKYTIQSAISQRAFDELQQRMTAELEKTQEAIKANADGYAYFKKLLACDVPKTKQTTIGIIDALKAHVANDGGVIPIATYYRPSNVNPADSLIVKQCPIDLGETKDTLVICALDGDAAAQAIVMDWINHSAAVREMALGYTKEEFEAHKNVWLYIKKFGGGKK